jgi:hypothetical protein
MKTHPYRIIFKLNQNGIRVITITKAYTRGVQIPGARLLGGNIL